jgi:hypothetical protein
MTVSRKIRLLSLNLTLWVAGFLLGSILLAFANWILPYFNLYINFATLFGKLFVGTLYAFSIGLFYAAYAEFLRGHPDD